MVLLQGRLFLEGVGMLGGGRLNSHNARFSRRFFLKSVFIMLYVWVSGWK